MIPKSNHLNVISLARFSLFEALLFNECLSVDMRTTVNVKKCSQTRFTLLEKMYQFPIVLKQMVTNLVALNNTNLLSYCSGHQKSNIKLSGLKSRCCRTVFLLWRFQGRILFLAFSSFQKLPAFLGLWPHPSSSNPVAQRF